MRSSTPIEPIQLLSIILTCRTPLIPPSPHSDGGSVESVDPFLCVDIESSLSKYSFGRIITRRPGKNAHHAHLGSDERDPRKKPIPDGRSTLGLIQSRCQIDDIPFGASGPATYLDKPPFGPSPISGIQDTGEYSHSRGKQVGRECESQRRMLPQEDTLEVQDRAPSLEIPDQKDIPKTKGSDQRSTPLIFPDHGGMVI